MNPNKPRNAAHWQGIFDDLEEVDIEVSKISGRIPEDLAGTLYRNGPGKRVFSKCFFDGDGMIRALTLTGEGRVFYKSRFVQTDKYRKELGSKRKKIRTAGTNLPGGILTNAFRIPADEANTHVFYQDGKLLASEEGGHPWRMDPDTLHTEGEEHFDGQLPRKVAFSAHPHYDANTGEIYNFGMVPGKVMGFQCYKINKSQQVTMLAHFPCHKGTFAHDYALSSKWMVFILGPLAGNLGKFLFGLSSFFDTMQWYQEWGTQIVLVPRDGGKPLILETDSFSIGHILSAWDEGDDVVIDVSTSDNMNVMKSVQNYRESAWPEFAEARVSRLRINTKNKSIERHVISDVPAEFARIHPKMECQPTSWAYLASNTHTGEGGLFRATMRLNRETGKHELFDFGEHAVALEPVFIPKANARSEEEGYLMVYVYNSKTQTTDVAILDAQAVNSGPLATIYLPVNAGTTFHGTWVSKQA